MRVIGTAGHVDHGKSTLIAALTGIHPDRLKEEQAREMTIELGFGWLTLPNGEEVGIVDVPGHRDFIENMLSGIGGIDAALLVIAADEGVMPQTREHLAILDLLQIPAGLIVLTKTDLASDPAWLALVETDIRLAVSGTVLKDASIIRISAKARTGLNELITHLQNLLTAKPARLDLLRPRLPIDRAFTMSGFGTVVTGTLSDGHFSSGDEVELLPSGIRGRIRGLQTHRKKAEAAVPGSRTAVNISGVDLDQVRRGDVLAHPGQYQATRRVDAQLRLLPDINAPVLHGAEVKFFTGASETVATVRLLGTETLHPGETGWVQLELRQPVVTVRGDRYIIRRPSPGETLGGGIVVDHQPKGRHKRFDGAILQSLQALAKGSPAEILFEAALGAEIASLKEVITRSRLETEAGQSAIRELLATGTLVSLDLEAPQPGPDSLVAALPVWQAYADRVTQMLSSYHQEYRLRRGMPREELKSRLKITPRIFNALVRKLGQEHRLEEQGSTVSRPGHEVRLNEQEQARVEGLMRKFAASPFSPPGVIECRAEVGEEVLNALLESGALTAVAEEVLFRTTEYTAMTERVRAVLQERELITLAEVRDLFQTSRKYAQAFLEHLDRIGLTIRDGDGRRLRNP